MKNLAIISFIIMASLANADTRYKVYEMPIPPNSGKALPTDVGRPFFRFTMLDDGHAEGTCSATGVDTTGYVLPAGICGVALTGGHCFNDALTEASAKRLLNEKVSACRGANGAGIGITLDHTLGKGSTKAYAVLPNAYLKLYKHFVNFDYALLLIPCDANMRFKKFKLVEEFPVNGGVASLHLPISFPGQGPFPATSVRRSLESGGGIKFEGLVNKIQNGFVVTETLAATFGDSGSPAFVGDELLGPLSGGESATTQEGTTYSAIRISGGTNKYFKDDLGANNLVQRPRFEILSLLDGLICQPDSF